MMDPNSVKVKTEAIDAAAGGGGAAKPKFVPKAPVKKDSKPEAAAR